MEVHGAFGHEESGRDIPLSRALATADRLESAFKASLVERLNLEKFQTAMPLTRPDSTIWIA